VYGHFSLILVYEHHVVEAVPYTTHTVCRRTCWWLYYHTFFFYI